VLLSDASLSSKCTLQNQPKSVALNQRMADLPNLGVSFLGPDQFDVILRWFRDYSERGQQIRLQHSVLRSATQGTRLCFQCDLCSTARTKSGHADLHNCYAPLDDRRKRKDSRLSGRYILQTFFQLQPTGWNRDLANRQFSSSLGGRSPMHFSSLQNSGKAVWPELTMTTVESGRHLLVTGGAPAATECCERFPVPEQSKRCSDFRGIDFWCPGL